jgi:hypothetical protein
VLCSTVALNWMARTELKIGEDIEGATAHEETRRSRWLVNIIEP